MEKFGECYYCGGDVFIEGNRLVDASSGCSGEVIRHKREFKFWMTLTDPNSSGHYVFHTACLNEHAKAGRGKYVAFFS